MKIAIHHTPESYSDLWIQYCEEKQITFKLVNCYDSDIVAQLDECDGLMWHWDQNDYKAALFARQLTISLEKKGLKVFPDINTAWHHDDKVGQKYLLEAIGGPFVKSYVFYSKQDALEWISKTNFPKVFKLRGGASSVNVSLARTKREARVLVKKAFGKGFWPINRFSRLKDRLRVLKRDKNLKAIRGIISGLARLIIPTEVEQFSHNQKGYIYFQEFIPGNDYDTRLAVIGNKCFGLRRYCRKGDFRASGSGLLEYNPELIDKKSIQYAFETAKKLRTQSVFFDFIWDNHEPKIIELSYCALVRPSYEDFPGYWDSDLNWNEKIVNPQYFMIEDFIEELRK